MLCLRYLLRTDTSSVHSSSTGDLNLGESEKSQTKDSNKSQANVSPSSDFGAS